MQNKNRKGIRLSSRLGRLSDECFHCADRGPSTQRLCIQTKKSEEKKIWNMSSFEETTTTTATWRMSYAPKATTKNDLRTSAVYTLVLCFCLMCIQEINFLHAADASIHTTQQSAEQWHCNYRLRSTNDLLVWWARRRTALSTFIQKLRSGSACRWLCGRFVGATGRWRWQLIEWILHQSYRQWVPIILSAEVTDLSSEERNQRN